MRRTDTYENWISAAQTWLVPQKFKKICGPYKLSITAVRPDKRRRDLDNIIKPISDLLQHAGIIENDCMCEMVCARWVTSGDPLAVNIEPATVEVAGNK